MADQTPDPSHQIEHHLLPDLPAHCYAEISEEGREICRRYGVPYKTAHLRRQFSTAVKRICRLALPPSSALPFAKQPAAAA